jgi:hypothetical protein
MLNKTEQSDRDGAPNENGKPENCYCSALPKGSVCLPCYTQWLRERASPPGKLSKRAGMDCREGRASEWPRAAYASTAQAQGR